MIRLSLINYYAINAFVSKVQIDDTVLIIMEKLTVPNVKESSYWLYICYKYQRQAYSFQMQHLIRFDTIKLYLTSLGISNVMLTSQQCQV